MKLARQVISTFEKPLDMKAFKDEYQSELRRIIDAKVAGEDVIATEEETPSKVVDLMEALRKSLATVSESKKKPAKAEIAETKAPGEEGGPEAQGRLVARQHSGRTGRRRLAARGARNRGFAATSNAARRDAPLERPST